MAKPSILDVGAGRGDPRRHPLWIDMEMGFAPAVSSIVGVTPQCLVFEADGATPRGG
ncbi:MAG: hypothetical protein P9E24_06980 [Candidatus Competibacter sp.]|nr:hypothetical protein [Candidatus Competibacter sp.]MDG4582593.1 hypothetical protein [Candidatus Competibacter sp.]